MSNNIWTNASVSRSVVQPNTIQNVVLKYLKLTISNGVDAGREISVFPNMEYKFRFYDANYGTIRSVTGLVTTVYSDQICIKVLNSSADKVYCAYCNNRDNCSKAQTSKLTSELPMPTCNCILNPPDVSKYDDPEKIYILIQNILNVEYVKSDSTCNEDTSKEEEVKVMLLGISATTVKAIIVRLEFFDDSMDEALKYVDLAVGGIYNIAYECYDKTIYETIAKVVSIEEVPEQVCQTGKGYVRENVGMNNAVYTRSSCCSTSKDEFMTAPPVKKIKLVVDTSEDFHGRYESIMLDAIRDVELIQAPDQELSEVPEKDPNTSCEGCPYRTCNCCPDTCGHTKPLPPKPNCDCGDTSYYTFAFRDGSKAAVTGQDVEIVTPGGKLIEMSLKELFEFYLGIG